MLWRVALATLGAGAGVGAPARRRRRRASGFVERDVRVLQTWHGQPAAISAGRCRSSSDIDRDGSHRPDLRRAVATPRRHARGCTRAAPARSIYRLAGRRRRRPGLRDRRRRRHEPRRRPRHHQRRSVADRPGPGGAYLYSGRSGRLLHTFTGDAAATSSAARWPAPATRTTTGTTTCSSGARRGANAGAAYVFSGRNYKLAAPLRRRARRRARLGVPTWPAGTA